ncbi:MAG: hypothetical protein JJO71_28200 [Escherichia coli]|nr:hypothetical protein [Escherichia coli]
MNSICNTKVPYKAKVFFMFMMFMWVASVSDYTSFNFGKNPILMPIFIVILAYYYIRFCHKSYKPLVAILLINVVWNIASYLKYGGFLGLNFPPFYSIIIAHVAFNIYTRREFLHLFEKMLVMFCCLSIFVWLCANLIGQPFVLFMRAISVIKPSPPAETYSFLFGLGSQIEMGIRRNLGFTWEPGRFTCWILLGMYFNLVRNKFNIRNKHFYILFFSLLTTLSTTGYSLLALIVLFILINKKSNLAKAVIVLCVILAFPTVWGLSIMSDKIEGLMDLDAGLGSIEYHSVEDGMAIVCPQRFTGIYVSFMNFVNDIFLGFNQLSNSYVSAVLYKHSVIVSPSEGIIGILAKYGIFYGAFFYYWLIKSSSYLSSSLGYKGKLMFFLLFMGISFSYEFWENCILMYFYLCAFYHKFDVRYFDVKQTKTRL